MVFREACCLIIYSFPGISVLRMDITSPTRFLMCLIDSYSNGVITNTNLSNIKVESVTSSKRPTASLHSSRRVARENSLNLKIVNLLPLICTSGDHKSVKFIQYSKSQCFSTVFHCKPM